MKTEQSDTEKYMIPAKGTFDFNDVPLDDPRVWALLSSGRTKGIFQLESRLGQDWARKLQPQNIEELSALIALIRPACLNTGIADSFVKRKFDEETPDQINETLDNIIKDTHGLIVFQEQIIRIAQECAGMTEEEADSKVRKGIAKKKTEVVAEAKKFFKEKASTFGVLSEEQIEYILDYMTKASRYCVTGDTILMRDSAHRSHVNKSGYTVEYMYNIRNNKEFAKEHGHEQLYKKWKIYGNYGKAYSMCEDMRVRPNDIHDITDEGYALCVKIELSDGSSIKTTLNHKFPTPNGEKLASELSVGDELYKCGEYETNNSNTYAFSNMSREERRIHGKVETNGSYKKFQEYKRKTKDLACEMCKNEANRYEVHHIDGDRANSNEDNLIKLCVSCHKKEEYKNGRRKRGEKGYPVYTCKIASIENIGVQHVYNISMSPPNHNFVTHDKIITKNSFNKSHSVGYAEEAYSCAYIKTHFPLKFFCSWLSFSDWKPKPKEEMYELVQDAKLFGITVSTPCIHQKNENFKIDKTRSNTIMFGLKHIRGVGAAAIKTITKLDKRIESWPRLLSAIEQLKKNILEALVKSGACDKFGLPRIKMLRDIHVVKGYSDKDSDAHPVTKSLTSKELAYVLPKLAAGMELKDALKDMLDNNGCQSNRRSVIEGKIKYVSEDRKDTNNQNAAWEKIYLGLNLSCSLVDGVNKQSKDISISCRELFFKEASQKDINVVYASLDKVVTRVTSQKAKNPGKEYAILDISDGTGGLTGIMCWPKIYEEIKEELAEDKVAALYIKKNIWGGRIQYIVEKAEILG